MHISKIGKNGKITFVKLSAEDIMGMLREFWEKEPEPCVICGGPTKTVFMNGDTGRWDHVHDYHESGLDCKIVWRHKKSIRYKQTREQWRRENAQDLQLGYIIEDDYPDYLFLQPDDTWDDYHSYIASYEWRIKSRAAKRAAGGKCENCGKQGDYSSLHTHHLHYETLYQERPEDVKVLCAPCHKWEHGIMT